MIAPTVIMVSRNYIEYMRSPRWQKKRQTVFNYYGKRCYACRTTKGHIHVHHLDYSRLGNERLQDLMPLCADCHKTVTTIYRRNRRRGLRRVTMEYVKMMRNRNST